MAFSSGTFSLVAGNPVTTGSTISSTVHNDTLDDIADGLTLCVLKNGSQTITANIPFGGYRLTGIGAPTTTGDALREGSAVGGTTPAAGTFTTGSFSSTLAAGNTTITGTLSTTDTVTNTKTSGIVFTASSATTGALWHQYGNTSGALYLGVEGSAGGAILTGTTAYAAVFGTSLNKAVQIGANGVLVASFSSGATALTGTLTTSGAIIMSTTATPTGAGTGVVGQIAWDTSYLYVCTATNDWRRVALVDF